jgi:hypothetical protein
MPLPCHCHALLSSVKDFRDYQWYPAMHEGIFLIRSVTNKAEREESVEASDRVYRLT